MAKYDGKGVGYDWDKMRWVFISNLIVFIPIMIYFMFLFFQRRYHWPIKGRTPLLILASDLIYVIFDIGINLKNSIYGYPCWLTYFQSVTMATSIFIFYGIRMWLCHFSYYLSHARAEEEQRENKVLTQQELKELQRSPSAAIDSPSSSQFRGIKQMSSTTELTNEDDSSVIWYLDNRHLISRNVLIYVSVSIFVIVTLPFFLIYAVDPAPERGGAQCPWSTGNIYLFSLGIFVCITLFITSRYMREVKDGYHIVKLLRSSAYVAIILLLIWFLSQLLFEDWLLSTFPLHIFSMHVLMVCFFSLDTVHPIYMSYQTDAYRGASSINSSRSKDINTLDGVLAMTEGRAAFRAHLISEFSIENLVFYDEVNRFREKALEIEEEVLQHEDPNDELTPQERLRKNRAGFITVGRLATILYEKCIVPGSEYEVNLPAEIREELDKKFEQVSKRVYPSRRKKSLETFTSENDHLLSRGVTFKKLRKERKLHVRTVTRDWLRARMNLHDISQSRREDLSENSIVRRANKNTQQYRQIQKQQFNSAPHYESTLHTPETPHLLQTPTHLSASSGKTSKALSFDSSVMPDSELMKTVMIMESETVVQNDELWTVDHSIFDAAQRSIFELMESDSFCRFRLTESYKLLKEIIRTEII